MNKKTLALILAAGCGLRVKHLLDEDEKIKPMMKFNQGRLIDSTISIAQDQVDDLRVLTYPSKEYEGLNKHIEKKGLKYLEQKAKHLPNCPSWLEVPRLLMIQKNCDRKYLNQFDSIITIPCDLSMIGFDLSEMIDFHYNNNSVLTMAGKMGNNKGGNSLTIGLNRDKISLNSILFGSSETFTDPGIFIWSKKFIKNPLTVLINGVMRYKTNAVWVDYGNPDNVKEIKEIQKQY